jgi:hypothetical protein
LKKGVLKARLVQAQYEQSEMLGKKTQNHPSAGPLFKKKNEYPVPARESETLKKYRA